MSFPAYDSYRDSGVEWLGQVPSHWRLTRVKDVAEVINGFPFDSAGFDPELGMPLIRIRDLNSETAEVRFAGPPVAAAEITADDVLIGMDGDFNVGRWRGAERALLNQRVCALRVRDYALSRFLEMALVDPLKRINALTYSTTVKHLSSYQVAAIRLALPASVEELNAIAAFLDRETAKIDALVEAQRRLIELLKEKRQAVISHAVTKGLDPTVPMKDSGVEWLGEVPAHWEVERLASWFREVSEQGDDSLPILSVSIHDGVSDEEPDPEHSERKVTRSDDRTKYKRVQPNDLVYNMMRAWQGGFGTVQVPGAVSPAYVVARPTRPQITRFVELLLRTPKAVEEMRRRSRGITDFRLRLYWDEFKDIRVAIPSDAEVDGLIDQVSGLSALWDSLSSEADAAITLLLERRAALISAAVTGKIDVRGLAIEPAEAA